MPIKRALIQLGSSSTMYKEAILVSELMCNVLLSSLTSLRTSMPLKWRWLEAVGSIKPCDTLQRLKVC